MTGPAPWIWALLDVPAARWAQARTFWGSVTGWAESSARRGEREELVTLHPAQGAAWVRLQAVGGPAGVHLDLDSPDLDAAVGASRDAGAVPVDTRDDAVVVRSPGGLLHGHTRGDRAEMVRPSGRGASLLDQVCLDIPAPWWEREVAYWEQLTGRTLQTGTRPEFARLVPAEPGGGLRLLLQRLDSAEGPVRAHLDLAVADRPTEVRRHRVLGATEEATLDHWTVLRSPDGRVYCVTDRDPATGRP